MATGYVTKRAVDALKAEAGISFLWDAGDGATKGFGVRMTPAGVKSYVYQYRLGGRGSPVRRYTIGRHGDWTPEQARNRAKELATSVGQGIDPIDAQEANVKANERAKAVASEQEREARELAFDAYAQTYLALHVRPYTPDSFTFADGILRNHAIPALGSKPLPAITKRDMVRLFDRIPANRPSVRRNAFAVLRKLFNWAKGRDDIGRSPMDGMQPPAPVASRDRVLDDAETSLAVRAAAALPYPFGPMFELLFATGQRREEAAGLNWTELDRKAALWTLPGARAKNGEAHLVPLNRLALAALDRAAGGRLDWPGKGLVFTTTGDRPVSGHSKAKANLDAGMLAIARQDAIEASQSADDVHLVPWRLHDARRTLATGLQRLGVRFEVTEAVLNHTSGRSRSGVAAVYQRHGWGPEKRAALDAWGAFVEGLLDPAPIAENVIALRRGDAA